jgi:hypothetical protein
MHIDLWKIFKVGANIKVINRNMGTFGNAWGFGFDIGTQWTANRFKIGIVARDIPSTFTAWSFSYTKEEKAIFSHWQRHSQSTTELALHRSLRVSPKMEELKKEKRGYPTLIEVDFNISANSSRYSLLKTETVDIAPAAGIEVGYNHMVFLRAGLENIQQISINPEINSA